MTDELQRYVCAHTSPEDDLLRELDRRTHLCMVQPRMLSGQVQGRLLRILTAMFAPRNVLEIGTFTGYSALCIAAGLPAQGHLDTIEPDDELETFIRSFFDRSAYRDRITLHIGTMQQVVPTLRRKFDMVFMDGDKREYPEYYSLLMDGGYLHSGSVILADNVLWSGKVVQPVAHNDRHTLALLEFNDRVAADPRVENVILPLRDGLNIIRIK